MDNIPPTRMQQKVSSILDSTVAHAVVVILVFLDILIITILLVIDLCVSQELTYDCKNCTVNLTKYERIRNTQFAISVFQLAILSAFLLEIMIRILSNVPAIRHDKWQVFDCLLVTVVFILFTILLFSIRWRAVAYSVGCFISIRLWRIGRLYHGIKDETLLEADVQIRSFSDHETQLKKAEHMINLQKRQMERLEQSMLFFKSLAQASANGQTHSESKFMEAQDSNSTNSTLLNEAYTSMGENSRESQLQLSSSNPASNQIPNGSSEKAPVLLPTVQSEALVFEELLQKNNHGQVSAPLDRMRSYTSQDGIPMTDL